MRKGKVVACVAARCAGTQGIWDVSLAFSFFRILLSHPYTSIVQKHREVALHAHGWGQKLYGCSKGDEGPPSLTQPALFRALIRSVKPREEILGEGTDR